MLTVNGEVITYHDGMTVEELVLEKGFHISRIAVERNGEIVPKAKYKTEVFKDEDVIEIVSFVGGG